MKKLTALTLMATMVLSAVPSVAFAEEADTKTVRIGIPYDPTTFDYAEMNLADSVTQFAELFGEGLIKVMPDGSFGGGIAESWKASEDGKEWTFTLRQGLTYSDGETPITTEDLVYAVKRLINPEAGHYNADGGLSFVNGEAYYSGECEWEEVGVEAIDDYTIKYTFVNPAYEVDFTSSSVYYPLEEAFVEQYGVEYGSSAEKFLGNGPYILTDWVADSSYTLDRNENYWDPDSVFMDRFEMVIGATGDTGMDMLMAGDLDFAPSGNAIQNQTMTDAGYEIAQYTGSYRCLNLNAGGQTDETGEFLSNANFRKALNAAIDREAICASLYTSDQPAYRLVAPSEAGVEAFFDEEYPYEAWSTTADQETAQEYLNLALEELGKTAEEIPTFELLCYESQGSIDVLSAIQDMWKTNLGIESEIDPQTVQVMVSMAMSGDYDFWLGGNSLSQPDALSSFLSGYTTEAAQTSNLRGYEDAAFDDLYNAALAAPTIQERKDAYFEVEKYFCDNTMSIILGWSNSGYCYSAGYTGLFYDVNPHFLYLDVEE